ncbi:uncharacterized protein TEOVI_000075000 [Trypanosoma equiperdum]|uniref:Transmembrane protein n=3 Tax=Trypanozoon TaxID=39700 RepID=Q57WE1_TRYB2|nr:hypothetical protein, conserved [Trypanosoma brucei brucei TREU927]AAX70092.1 hypothetical protein, conserved [Trypanosoma brucei]AAZ10438.1 hypothetical protein, conserved [Trypanosoma brucei brucei TREU927]RHW73877.1 hypothetical protein DPX39_030039900 [Trypanosoma brucei equiperdum]SCU69193.1 hypothetical protein, conserved [Trypanosoma equiperdum]
MFSSYAGCCLATCTTGFLVPRGLLRSRGGGSAAAFAGSSPSAPLICSKCAFIEHNTCPKKWRNPEKVEVSRRHGGVKLGSEAVRIREQAAVEQQLVDADKFTNWNIVWGFAAAAALLLVALNILLEAVEPVPSPEYTPYVPGATTITAPAERLKNEKFCSSVGSG